MAKYSFHKGLKANLPSTGLVEGHYYQCTDTGELYLATSATTKVLVAVGASAYQKPSSGIPKADLVSDVQASLEKADSALQSHQSLALAISALTGNPSSITLNSTAARTYQTCAISSRTSITLSGGASNAGYEHYILFHNTGSSDCVLTKGSTMVGPSTITVKAGKYLEMSWIYTGSNVVITNSAEIG